MATDAAPQRRPALGVALGEAALACCLGRQAHADASGLAAQAPVSMASDGPNVRVPDLRAFVDAMDAPLSSERSFTFTPSIGLESLLTDNAQQVARPRQADLVTTFLPALLLSGHTPRIQANIAYAPRIQSYAETSGQNQVVENFNGSALLTAVPDTLFLQLRGYGTQQSANGNAGRDTLPYQGSRNRINTVSFEASPYVTQRFDGDGTLQIGYVLNYTTQTGESQTAPVNLFNGLAADRGGLAGTTRSNEEYATFTTGENFGRLNDSVRLDSTQFTAAGGSVLSGAHRSTAIDDFAYGLDRNFALLGSIGYEDIAYAGLPPIVMHDAVWSAGVRVTPNEAGSVTVTYGHKDGFNAFALSLSYRVTVRLRVFANYTEGLTSSAEELQDNLDGSTVDQFGNTVSAATGAPTLVADQLLGLQDTLYRLRRFSLTAVSTHDRDTFSLTVEEEARRVVASSAGSPGVSDHGTSASGSWTHEFSEALSGTATLRYSHTDASAQGGSTDTAGLFLQAAYAFSPTVSGTFEYFITRQSATGGALGVQTINRPSFVQNAVLVGIRKTF